MSGSAPELLISVGTVIRQWRAQHGWSLADLAERSGVPRGHISDIERGRIHTPTLETLEKLAPALGLSVWDVHIRTLPDPVLRPPTGRQPRPPGVASAAKTLPPTPSGSTLSRIERTILEAQLPPAVEALALKAAEQAVQTVIAAHRLSASSAAPADSSPDD